MVIGRSVNAFVIFGTGLLLYVKVCEVEHMGGHNGYNNIAG